VIFVSAGNKKVHAERKNNMIIGITKNFFIEITPEAWNIKGKEQASTLL